MKKPDGNHSLSPGGMDGMESVVWCPFRLLCRSWYTGACEQPWPDQSRAGVASGEKRVPIGVIGIGGQ